MFWIGAIGFFLFVVVFIVYDIGTRKEFKASLNQAVVENMKAASEFKRVCQEEIERAKKILEGLNGTIERFEGAVPGNGQESEDSRLKEG